MSDVSTESSEPVVLPRPELREDLRKYVAGEISGDGFKTVRSGLGIYSQRQEGKFMVRTKIPSGILPSNCFNRLAAIIDRYCEHPVHITTRQDLQFYDVELPRLPDFLDELYYAGIISRNSCGNSIRNVTVCDMAGICAEEVFDVMPVAKAVSGWFLEKSIAKGLPRKFKITFSGCSLDCGGGFTEDIGAIAAVRGDGEDRFGFKVLAGGGQGGAPKLAQTLENFVPVSQIHIVTLAILNVFNRHGARVNRNRARLKFMVEKIGFDKFRELYLQERESLAEQSIPPLPPMNLSTSNHGETVLAKIPVGDLTVEYLKALGRLMNDNKGASVRTTKSGDLLFYGLSSKQKDDVRDKLTTMGITPADPGFRSTVFSCTGAATCNEGIARAKSLAQKLEPLIGNNGFGGQPDNLTIAVDGCPNSCARHHVADIGLQGSAKKIGGRYVPHYQIYLGGVSYGPNPAFSIPVSKVPAKRAIDAVERLLELFKENRLENENIHDLVRRLGVALFRDELAKFGSLPPYEDNRDAYLDWGADVEFNLEDVGPGECAGAAMEMIDGLFEGARRDVESARTYMESGDMDGVMRATHQSMAQSAKALLVTYGLEPASDEETFRDFNNKVIMRGFVSEEWKTILAPQDEKPALAEPDVPAWLDLHERFIEDCMVAYTRINAQTNVEEREIRDHATTRRLNLTGVKCPFNYIKVKLALEEVDSKTRLEVLLDEGSPIVNVPKSLRNDGHKIISMEPSNGQYLLVVEKV